MCANSLLRTTSRFAAFLSSITIRTPSFLLDSSLISPMPSITLFFDSSAMFFTRSALLTVYGISLTMNLFFFSSKSIFDLRVNPPLPVRYADMIPLLPTIKPPVGKSGPFTIEHSSSMVISLLSTRATSASMISVKLCGGMLVAIPTAIPVEPFISKFGIFEGKRTGSRRDASKLSTKSTVFFPISARSSSDMEDILHSVYLMAAGESPSTDPKLPCPSMRGHRRVNVWAMRTRLSYMETSPCGWYFPKTSPTILADFFVGLL